MPSKERLATVLTGSAAAPDVSMEPLVEQIFFDVSSSISLVSILLTTLLIVKKKRMTRNSFGIFNSINVQI